MRLRCFNVIVQPSSTPTQIDLEQAGMKSEVVKNAGRFNAEFDEFAARHGYKRSLLRRLAIWIGSRGSSSDNGAADRFAREFDVFTRGCGYAPAVSPELVLESLNLSPSLVVDVGVQGGTPWLYETFSHTPFLLVDPQRGGTERLQYRPKDFTFLNIGLGDKPGTLDLREEGAKSTFLARTGQTAGDDKLDRYSCEIRTLDQVLDEHLPAEKSFGLKLDTEGFELEIMAGLSKYLDHVEFVIAEVSVLDRFVDSYNFSDLIAVFREKNLRFYNIINPASRRVRYYDCLFLKSDNPLFRNNVYKKS